MWTVGKKVSEGTIRNYNGLSLIPDLHGANSVIHRIDHSIRKEIIRIHSKDTHFLGKIE